jgi:serine/threonine-protein kinase
VPVCETDPADLIGARFGAYQARELLGVGGMGVVYRAEIGGRPYALKVLHPDRVGDLRAIQRLRDEATVGGVVSHDNVVSVIDAGAALDGAPYLVMEYVRGEPLGDVIEREGPMGLRRALSIVRQLLSGLQALHRAGIVHADVKSDNILVDLDGDEPHAKLIDFGLARFSAARVVDDLASERLLSGTPEYMAPEVIRGEPASFAADLYAVGVILYELVTGTTPFSGGASTDIMARHLHDEVVPPSLRCADRDLPTALDNAVLRALQKRPAARFPSAAAFEAALASVIIRAESVDGRPRRRLFSTDAPTLQWTRDDLAAIRHGRLGRGTPDSTTDSGMHRTKR